MSDNETRTPSPLKKRLDELGQDKPRMVIIAIGMLVILFLLIGGGDLFKNIFTSRPRYQPDLTGYRIGMVFLTGAAGFGLGWFFSPAAKSIRRILALVIFAAMGLLVIADHGALGWGAASILSWALFFLGFGYWMAGVVKYLAAKPTTFGSAEWAKPEELSDNKLFDGEGFRVGKFTEPQGIVDVHYPGNRHLLTVAPTTSGKGTTVIVPNLLSYEGSIVVIDPKGENAMITAEHRLKMGQDVHIVDPWGITGMKSSRFNPLDWLKKGDVDLPENAMISADALIVPTGSTDQFWVDKPKSLISGAIAYLATHPYEDGDRTLGRLRDLLSLDGDELNALFKRMLESDYALVRNTASQFLQIEDKLLSSILASAQAQTNFLDSGRLRENLSASDFTFEDLKTKPMTIYLVLPADRLETFGRWLRLLIQQALTVNARNIETKPKKPVLFLLDEMAALGRLSMVEQAFGLMAGYGLQLWGVVQDLSQLKRIYGNGWETFMSNAGMVQYFGSRDRMTAEYFSALCGETTVWDIGTGISRAMGHSSGQGGASSSDTTTTSENTSGKQRKLAYPDELMRMHKSKQLLLIENMNPILAQKLPWFDDPELKDLGVNLHALSKESDAD